MSGFVGRMAQLRLLAKRLDRVEASGGGVAVAVRGRRQVGKSRLAQEFCDRSAVPYLYFSATKGVPPADALGTFLSELRDSSLPANAELVPTVAVTWADALTILAGALPARPSIVVLDEVPWLAEQDELFDAALQTAWDRQLSVKPVVLLLLGSDIHMMERLTSYDRPFFGRADNLVLGPLNPAETALAVDLTGADAIDAHLVSGGLPGVLRTWPTATPALRFLEDECADPAAAVFSVPESALMAEFPTPDQARRVIEAVGSGDRTHASIAASAGRRGAPLASGSLSPLLRQLVTQKRVLAMDEPLSTQPGRPALYRVADSNLRLYLAAGREAQEQARRGRPEAGFRIIQRRWATWRGRTVETIVRESLELAGAAGALPWPDVGAVGGWWNRQFDPEVDLVGADRAPVAREVYFVGSVKWLTSPFGRSDLARLLTAGARVPGYSPGVTGHVVVSMSGTEAGLDAGPAGLVWTPTDIVSAWPAAQ